MTTEEKISYIIGVLNEIISDSKNIGELPTYDPEADSTTQPIYAPAYISAENITKKVNLKEYLKVAIGEVPSHTHDYSDINGIGDYKIISLDDDNDNVWKVIRLISDTSNDSFKILDEIMGFEDAAKTTYLRGIIISSGVSIPSDLRNKSKVFIIDEKINL